MTWALGDDSYLAELQSKARELGLSQQPQWQRLLHYRHNRIFPGYTSTVDFPGFFFAPSGKTDPVAEMDAALAAFFSEELHNGESAQCRMRARYEWLRSQLDFDPIRLPSQRCQRLDEWVAGLNAGSLELVFASSDLSSPATMFGHTLLRLDARDQASTQTLLAYAINYAADVGREPNPVFYVAGGLAGGYSGYFGLFPYYEKVKEYARIEHRDLWEYPLNLSHDEIERMLWHLWEMRGVASGYYFFSENCSFQLLTLIEAARPDLNLSDRFDSTIPYTIPTDTIRALRDKGLLGAPEFRPALTNRLQHMLNELPAGGYEWVLAYAHGDIALNDATLASASPQDKARLLEAAHDYLYYLFQSDDLPRDVGFARARAALLERSQLDAKAEFTPVPHPAYAPEDGHESSRWSVGTRTDRDHTALALRARGAYHDRLDPPAGYLPGGELEFFDLGLLASEGVVRISDFRLVSVQSVAAWDRAFKPWSWQVSTGARRFGLDMLSALPATALGFYVDGGGGITWSPIDNLYLYGLGFAALDVNRDAEMGYALAGGLRSGIAAQWTHSFTQQLEADALNRIAGGAQEQVFARLSTQWQLRPDDGIRLLLNYGAFGGNDSYNVELRWLHYF